MKTLSSPFIWIILVVVGGTSLLPIITNSVSLREDMFLMLMLVILASSINIIMGYTGYVSFGHIVFFGLGGYLAFFLMKEFQVQFMIAALIGGVGASLIAFLIGIPVLRLRGAYFALATIGINEAFRTFFTNFDLFGGAVGMFFNFSVYDAYGGAKNAGQLAYYAMAVLTLATIATSFIIKKSKFGLGLMAIREDQDASMVLGIDPARLKVLTYTISAFFPAVAGAIFFFKNGLIEPHPAFDLYRSIEALVMVMLGGYGTVTGPIVGAVVYERLRGFLITNPTLSNAHLVIAGVMLLLIVLFVTAGVIGWVRQRVPTLRRYLE
ncbi:MAG: branched-chain amino acid ABC transporter permease [Chloroflexi bacterium]|nr:branched-chain amino acid ABC transporter permease [Chloroflexota bacterium]